MWQLGFPEHTGSGTCAPRGIQAFPGSESGSLFWGCCCQLLGEGGKSSRQKVKAKLKPKPTATCLL